MWGTTRSHRTRCRRLIRRVHATLTGTQKPPAEAAAEKQQPAVPPKKSVFPDYIICLEDGKKLKMLKRHLQTSYSLTPAQYREKWGLPHDYPMVAPSYAEKRSTLAKTIGLGRRPQPAAAAPIPGAPKGWSPAQIRRRVSGEGLPLERKPEGKGERLCLSRSQPAPAKAGGDI